MTRICLITDQHFGARNDSSIFHDYFEKFYSNTFFSNLDGIDAVFILGDTFDRRKFVNFQSLYRAKQMFFDRLAAMGMPVYMLIGNHDTFYKNTNEVNSPELVLTEYSNIKLISNPEEVVIGDHTICMVPWICADNIVEAMTLMESTTSTICMGHFEIQGFAMYKGMESHDGLERRVFDRFELVFSGHYHHRSTDGHVFYLGNPYELTWQDYNDPRGFHILDLETRDLTFVENPYKMFHKLHYDDAAMSSAEEFNSLDFSQYANTYVKVIVRTKNNPYWFDLFIDKLEKAGVADIQVVDDHLHLDLEDDDDIINEAEDTITILKKYVDGLEMQTDKSRLESLLRNLYNEALSIE